MGDGKPLSDEARNQLLPGLRQHPTTLILLAYNLDHPVGIAVCFGGFSTFAAKPLINIHDLAVLPEYRGRGIGRRLLEAVERKNPGLGCCQVNLGREGKKPKGERVLEGARGLQGVSPTGT